MLMQYVRKKKITTLLGIDWQEDHIAGALVRRANGSVRVERVFRFPLSLDPLTHDPELAGRELRQRLDEAGIRERRCVAGLPQSWALTAHTQLPDLEGEDLDGFLEVEAEKSFPYPPEELSISVSKAATKRGEKYATLVAVPKSHLTLLEKVFKAARLKPVSFSIGITALRPAKGEATEGRVILAAAEQHLGLEVRGGGGVLSLRMLRNVFHSNGSADKIETDLLARELRITLGRLPQDLRRSITSLDIYGRGAQAGSLQQELAPHAARLGLTIEEKTPGLEPRLDEAGQHGSQAAVALASRHLLGQPSEFEFLPPNPNAWQAKLARFSSRKLFWLGYGGGGLVALVALAFLAQHIRLSSLEQEWAAMAPVVREVEALQNDIRKFRPWYDRSFRTLSVLQLLAEAFPEDGSVTAKTIEVRNLNMVSCSGTAREHAQFLQVWDHLRQAPQVADLQVQQVQGTAPLQFIFHFRWIEGAQHEPER
jgi:hypothetical protein